MYMFYFQRDKIRYILLYSVSELKQRCAHQQYHQKFTQPTTGLYDKFKYRYLTVKGENKYNIYKHFPTEI